MLYKQYNLSSQDMTIRKTIFVLKIRKITMGAENIIGGIIAGILSPVLLPVGIVSGIMSLKGESVKDKWDRAIDKIHERQKEKQMKYYSGKIKEFKESGNFNYANVGLRDELGQEIDEIDIERDLLPSNCTIGMVFQI